MMAELDEACACVCVRMISFSNNADLASVAEAEKEEEKEEVVVQVVEAVVANDNVEVTQGMSHDYLQKNTNDTLSAKCILLLGSLTAVPASIKEKWLPLFITNMIKYQT